MEIYGQCLDVLLYSYFNAYNEYVHKDRVRVKLSKALYETIEARIWYNTLSSKRRREGFIHNVYDNSVLNKIYKGDQLSVLLHK